MIKHSQFKIKSYRGDSDRVPMAHPLCCCRLLPAIIAYRVTLHFADPSGTKSLHKLEIVRKITQPFYAHIC